MLRSVRLARIVGWLSSRLVASVAAIGLLACDGVVVLDEGPTRVEYTGSMSGYLLVGAAVLAVTGAIAHLLSRLRSPARGNLATVCLVLLGALGALFLWTQPLVTHVLVDGASGVVTITSRAPRQLLAERVERIPIVHVHAVEVTRWPSWFPGTPLRLVELVVDDGTRDAMDVGFECLDLRLAAGKIAALTGHPHPSWQTR